MSRPRLAPLAAGLVAALLAFGAVALATNGDGKRSAPRTGSSAAPDAPPPRTAEPSSGRAVFARMGCGSCHHLTAAGSAGQIGPDLDLRLAAHTRASLRAKILAPGQGSMMPADFGARMTGADLDALVNFLVAATPSR